MDKIKFLLLFFSAAIALNANAQQLSKPEVDSLMTEAYKYYKGSSTQLVDYTKYFEITKQCAEAGSPAAMYNLGNCYFKGTGTSNNINAAIKWFTKSADKNYAKSYIRLGHIYKKGIGGSTDYYKAFANYSTAASLGNTEGICMKAYMLYTGIGCAQDYEQAYPLFRISAYRGNTEAMRLLGLCYKNGYGVDISTDSATYWFKLAMKKGRQFRDSELNIDEPENADITGSLVEKIKAAQSLVKQPVPINSYSKVYHNIPAKDIEGTYSGWLLTYDWSGKHVVKADKLQVTLSCENDSIKGVWVENDSTAIPISAILTKKGLVFNNMFYVKHSHYYRANGQLLRFNKTFLELIKTKDSNYLSGNLEMFAVRRNEPAKPMYVALVQTAKGKSKQTINYVNEDGSPLIIKDLNVYPNPFTNIVILDFELKIKSKVQTKIFTLDGKEVYSNAVQQLSAGGYTLPIQPQQLAPGTYILHLITGKKTATAKLVKMD